MKMKVYDADMLSLVSVYLGIWKNLCFQYIGSDNKCHKFVTAPTQLQETQSF